MKKQKNKKSDIRYTPETDAVTLKTDGSRRSVRAAIKRAKAGDVVSLPAGEFQWEKKEKPAPIRTKAEKKDVPFHLRYAREDLFGESVPITPEELRSLPEAYFPVVVFFGQDSAFVYRSLFFVPEAGILGKGPLHISALPAPKNTYSPLETYIRGTEEHERAAYHLEADNVLRLGAYMGYNFAVREMTKAVMHDLDGKHRVRVDVDDLLPLLDELKVPKDLLEPLNGADDEDLDT